MKCFTALFSLSLTSNLWGCTTSKITSKADTKTEYTDLVIVSVQETNSQIIENIKQTKADFDSYMNQRTSQK